MTSSNYHQTLVFRLLEVRHDISRVLLLLGKSAYRISQNLKQTIIVVEILTTVVMVYLTWTNKKLSDFRTWLCWSFFHSLAKLDNGFHLEYNMKLYNTYYVFVITIIILRLVGDWTSDYSQDVSVEEWSEKSDMFFFRSHLT